MPKAIIELNDDGGQVAMTLFLEGGFQPESNAHQHAQIILAHLDSIAAVKSNEDLKWVEGSDAPKMPEQVVPRMVHTAEECRASTAESLGGLLKEAVVIHAPH